MLLVLLADDLVHDLLDQGGPTHAGLISLDQDLLTRLYGLLGPELDQVGAAIVLDNLGLDDVLWLDRLASCLAGTSLLLCLTCHQQPLLKLLLLWLLLLLLLQLLLLWLKLYPLIRNCLSLDSLVLQQN